MRITVLPWLGLHGRLDWHGKCVGVELWLLVCIDFEVILTIYQYQMLFSGQCSNTSSYAWYQSIGKYIQAYRIQIYKSGA